MPVLNPPDAPDEICTHKVSVSFPIEAGAKFRQAAQFASDEWAAYQHDRSAIEGSNAYMKDGAREAIETASLRRLRGYAAQYFLITILVITANLRRLQKRPTHRRRARSGQRGGNQTTARAAAPA
jgi:hypothetical protein